jgi:rubredoxin
VIYTRTSSYQLNSTTTAGINRAMQKTGVPGYVAVDDLCTPTCDYCDVPPKPPSPAAPTPAPVPTPVPGPSPTGTKYKCTVCAHIYDPVTDAAPAPAGTKFEDLPATWKCPVCGAPKSAYEPIPMVAVYKCTVCAHIYDPVTDAAPAAAGTKFEDLPATWKCPVCGAPKSAYTKESADGEVVWVHTHADGDEDDHADGV